MLAYWRHLRHSLVARRPDRSRTDRSRWWRSSWRGKCHHLGKPVSQGCGSTSSLRRKLMRTFFSIALLGLLVLGCLRGSVPSDAKPVIEEFLRAASVEDSATVARLSTNEDPRRRVAAMHEREPDLLRAVQSNRRLQSSVVSGDSAYWRSGCPSTGKPRSLRSVLSGKEVHGWCITWRCRVVGKRRSVGVDFHVGRRAEKASRRWLEQAGRGAH